MKAEERDKNRYASTEHTSGACRGRIGDNRGEEQFSQPWPLWWPCCLMFTAAGLRRHAILITGSDTVNKEEERHDREEIAGHDLAAMPYEK